MRHVVSRRRTVLVVLTAAVAMGSPLVIHGQNVSKVGTTAGEFLQIGVGPRAMAQGGAFVAAANDVSSLYWNPAGLASVTGNEAFVSHSEWLGDINFDYVGVGLSLGDQGSIGFALTMLSVPEMLVRTEDRQNGTGETFDAADMALAVSYSRKVTDRFSVGATIKYISQRIWHSTATGFALDLGTQFRTDFFGGLTIGAAIFNFGTDMRLSGRDVRTFVDPDPRQLGNNNRVPANFELDTFGLPLNFQFGITSRPIDTRLHQLSVSIDALHPSSNDESINIGVEYGYQRQVFLRAGYQSLFLVTREGGLSGGLGIHQPLYNGATAKLDYAYRTAGRLGGVHVLGLALTF
jgi:Type IX secretion system protein PorV